MPRQRPRADFTYWNLAGRCACGRPLHYSTPALRAQMDALVREVGPAVTMHWVGDPTHEYRAQRHYLALHGVEAADLPDLARRGIVERLRASEGARDR